MIAPMLAASPAGSPRPPCAAATVQPPSFNAGKLRQGRFTYAVAEDGKPAGQFVLTIRRAGDGSLRLTGDAVGVDQHWESETTRGFQPKTAVLSLMRRGRPYRMELVYGARQVTATETTGRAPHAQRTIRRLAIGAATIDQRIDWASVMATSLAPGQTAAYRVFDALTGSSPLSVRAASAGVMAGPLGNRPAIRLEYQVCKQGKAEPYVVYATRDAPRVMLREDLRGHEVSILTRIEP